MDGEMCIWVTGSSHWCVIAVLPRLLTRVLVRRADNSVWGNLRRIRNKNENENISPAVPLTIPWCAVPFHSFFAFHRSGSELNRFMTVSPETGFYSQFQKDIYPFRMVYRLCRKSG